MSNETGERPLFSSRYGVSSNFRWDEPWRSRHTYSPFAEAYPVHRCGCPGTNLNQCRAAMTAEDLLCDECRDWCWAVDHADKRHRLLDALENPRQVFERTAKRLGVVLS